MNPQLRMTNEFEQLGNLTLIEKLQNVTKLNLYELNMIQQEFYRRYSGYIYKVATFACRYQPNPADLAKDVLMLTFTIAFNKIELLKLGKEVNDSEVQLVVKAWLGKIANRQFLNYINKFGKESYPLLDDNAVPSKELDEDEDHNILLPKYPFDKALDSLSERDRDVLLTYADYNCISTKKHLPDSVMKQLCKTYKTNSGNIRQIKTRSLKNIKQLLSHQF